MRALAYYHFGIPEVMGIDELLPPKPEPDEVVVAVHAVAMNPKDVLVRKGKFAWMSGRQFPKVPGYDLAGEVHALGRDVRGFRVGQPVFGMINRWSAGGAAELAAVPAREIAPKPARLSYEEAAAVPLAALTALQALRDLARVEPGHRVLVNGGSGGVGVYAIQIARVLGAHVVSVSSAANQDLCRDLGAHEALDYRADDPLAPERPYDAIFDVFGNRPYEAARAALASPGRYVTTIPRPKTVWQDLTTRWSQQPARLVVVRSRRRDLDVLAEWIEQGKLRPVIDRVLPLEEGPEAHRYLETKRARGKVVLSLSRSPAPPADESTAPPA